MKCALVFVIVMSACGELEPTAGLDPVFAGEDDCTKNGCGENSPVMRGVVFGELREDGWPNAEGLRITSVVSATGTLMRLQVVGDRLTGVALDDPTQQIAAGPGLVNTRINVALNGHALVIRISAWHAATDLFWVGPPVTSEYYDFVYRDLDDPQVDPRVETPLCSQALNGPGMIHAIVFAGDRYDPDTKKITLGPGTAPWFNIACFGSATAKMHLTGHTSAAAAKLGITPRTLDQRRAMLNAWTSNVCGTGKAFTHQGEPLVMRDSAKLIPYVHPSSWEAAEAPATYEAIWGPNGAVCLDTHRLESGDHADPAILAKITKHCSLPPPCKAVVATFPTGWQARGFVLTGNP